VSGQIIDATIVAAPKQRNTNDEKQAIKDGRIPEGWKDKPAKLAQKDRDARWTVKYTKAKVRDDGSVPPVDLAIPAFGYKNHVSIDRAHGLIRKWTATHAAAHDGARLEEVLDRANTASEVYADTAYRSAKNEDAVAARLRLAHSSQKAQGQGDAGAHALRQCAEVESAQRRRACVRASEGADGPVRANHRPGAGAAQDRARQSRLQHAPLRLAARARRARVRNMGDRKAAAHQATTHGTAARPNVTLREDVGPPHAALSTPENRVIGGVQMIQNLLWATGYNAFAIPLAAGVAYDWGVVLSPAFGAALMSLSTVIVAINATLLGRARKLVPTTGAAEPRAPETTGARAVAYGGLIDAIAGIAISGLAICGLAKILPAAMAASATIVLGVTLLIQFVLELVQLTSRSSTEAEKGRSGLLAVLLAGGTGVVLGVVGLLRADAEALISVAVISYGMSAILGAALCAAFMSFGGRLWKTCTGVASRVAMFSSAS